MLAPSQHTDAMPVEDIKRPELPNGWAITTLGDLCHKPQYGWTTKATTNGGKAKLLRTTDLSRGRVEWNTVPYCAEEPKELAKYLLEEGDIVVSRAGSVGLSALIGSCPEAVFASYLIRFRRRDGINEKYLYQFLQSPEYWEQVSQQTVGIALQNINAKKLAGVSIPLPPLAEQHRIVAEIEKQLTRLDASVDALKRAQANLKRYRASALKAACEGKLVPTEAELARDEGRDYESADRLLERIQAERRERWESQEKRRGKYKEPVAPDTSDLPELPEGWVWATVGQLSSRIEYGTSTKASAVPSGIPVLRMGNIQDGELNFSDLKYLEGDHPETQKTMLGHGELLFNRTNSAELVGKSAVYKSWHPKACFASYLIRVSFLSDTSSDYVCTFINSQHGRAYITQVRNQQVGQANVNGTKLAAMPIPLPPVAEQHRIVAEMERRLSVIQQAEVIVEANLAKAERLRQSILKQAFSGKLVPQDPSDEPASELLERIRERREAAQAAAGPKTRAKRRKVRSDPERQLVLGAQEKTS